MMILTEHATLSDASSCEGPDNNALQLTKPAQAMELRS
jgi:hypothetical protein